MYSTLLVLHQQYMMSVSLSSLSPELLSSVEDSSVDAADNSPYIKARGDDVLGPAHERRPRGEHPLLRWAAEGSRSVERDCTDEASSVAKGLRLGGAWRA